MKKNIMKEIAEKNTIVKLVEKDEFVEYSVNEIIHYLREEKRMKKYNDNERANCYGTAAVALGAAVKEYVLVKLSHNHMDYVDFCSEIESLVGIVRVF